MNVFGAYSHWKVRYKSEKAFSMCSKWHYTTRGWAYGDMTTRPDGLVAIPPSANIRRCVMPLWTHGHAFSLYKTSLLTPLLRHDTTRQGTARRDATIKVISIRCRALWDQKHEGAVRICQCTRSVAPTVLMFPSDQWNRNPAVESQSLPICQNLHSFVVVASSPTYDISNIDGNKGPVSI